MTKTRITRLLQVDIKDLLDVDLLAYTLNKIFLQDHSVRRYEIPEEEPMMAAEDMAF